MQFYENVFTPEDLRPCGFDIVSFIGKGDIAGGVYRLSNGDVLKVYRTKQDDPEITHLDEIDISSRLIHPAIVKTKGIITKEQCPIVKYDKYFNHALIMNFIDCRRVVPDLHLILNGCMGIILLVENNFVHTDIGHGNDCFTGNSYTFVDLNMDQKIDYPTTRSWFRETDVRLLRSLLDCLQVKNFGEFIRYHRGKITTLPGITLNPINLTPLQRELYNDLIYRVANPNIDIMLDIYEIPTHPVFKGVSYDLGSEEPRFVNFNDWPARHFDYMAPLRNYLSDSRIRSTVEFEDIKLLFEFIDLFYRYLPFVESINELPEIIDVCFRIIYYSDTKTFGKIVQRLNGHLRPRYFYHKCRSINDFLVAWELMALPYDQYMKINPGRFYEIVAPSDDDAEFLLNVVPNPQNHPLMPQYNGQAVINYQLANEMSLPTNVNVPYVFSKLTSSELMEFLDLYKIPYDRPDEDNYRFYLADLAKRTYIYLINKYQTQTIVTWPVLDLIHLSRLDINPTRPYSLESLQNMNLETQALFAQVLQLDNTAPNVRERIIRILRMNYLVRNY